MKLMLTACLALACVTACAQGTTQYPLPGSADGKTPAYDVVVIKPNKSNSNSISVNTGDDTYTATNVSLKMIMQNAYDIKIDLIHGLTGWADSERFDVQAKVVDMSAEAIKKLTPEERRAMLRRLLEDRFHLKVHKQVETLPVYEMVIAKSGSKLKEVEPPPPDTEADAHKTLEGIERGNMRMGSTQLHIEIPAGSPRLLLMPALQILLPRRLQHTYKSRG